MKKILKIFLVFSLAISLSACESKPKSVGDLKENVQQLDSVRTALNMVSGRDGVYGAPAEMEVVDRVFSQAKMKRYPAGDSQSGKDKQLWAIWFDNYTPEGNTLLEDYKHNRNYIVVLSNYGPYDYRSAEVQITDINGTEYYGFKIALRLE